MSKHKKHKPQQKQLPVMTRRVMDALAQVDDLIDRRKWAEAVQELEDLAQRHPREPEVFIRLFNVANDIRDQPTLLRAALRLAELRPNDPDIAFNVVGVYLGNVFPALALNALRKAVARWPDHRGAAHAAETIAHLEPMLKQQWAEAQLPAERAADLAILHEQAQVELNAGNYAEARLLAGRVLDQVPHFVPPLNNISLAFFLEGRLSEAAEVSRRVLAECEPDNVHALSNLVHYLCLLGNIKEARALAERLKSLPVTRDDAWIKKIEALSFAGDDVGVAQVFEQYQQRRLPESEQEAFLLHLAAAAQARLGSEVEARRLWERALKLTPGSESARENLADLKHPAGERNGPWAFSINQWVPATYVTELERLFKPARGRNADQVLQAATCRFLEAHPEMAVLTPILLERGDPMGRQFALHVAQIAKTPAMLEALKGFALGPNGTDQQRMEAAQHAAEVGLLRRGSPMQMWVKGQQTEILLMAYKITTEPKGRLPGTAQHMAEEAFIALQEGRPEEAEPLLEQLMARFPDNTAVLQNMAAFYGMRGDEKQAEALTRRAVEIDPNYIIGRCNLAQFAVRQGKLDEAEQWLSPVMEQPEFHISEYRAVCQTHIRLELGKGRREAAKSWLDMWLSAEPDAPDQDYWRGQVEPGRRFNPLMRWSRRGKLA